MGLTIYQMPHSPFCIPITRALGALGVPFQTIDVKPHTREEVIRATGGAYYQVPLLEHDGELVYESSADSLDVARYVDRCFAGGRLFPQAIEAAHRSLVAFIENELELVGFRLCDIHYVRAIGDVVARTLIIRHKERKFGAGCLERWEKGHDELMSRFVEMLAPAEVTLARQLFLFGEMPVYADFALFGVLENVTYGGHNALPSSMSNLARWRGELRDFRY